MEHLAAVQSSGLNEPLLPTSASPGYGISTAKPARPADVEASGQRGGGLWAAAFPVFEEPPTAFPQSSLWDTTVNLTNAILGAGLLALPRAYAGLGVLGGVALTASVGLTTHASIALMLRRTERSGRLTYAAVVEHAWGRWAGAAVRFSVVVGSAGFLVLYLVVVADLLVGSAEFSGVIPDLWPALPDPLPWHLQRTAVLTWVALLVAPALIPKTLGEVALVSLLKIFCTLLCVAALLVLLVALALQGRLPPVYWLPDPSFYGKGALERMRNFLAVVPVIMTAFVCHMSVHPCVQDLRDYTPSRMRTAVAGAVAISGAVYALAGVAGFCVWGLGVQGDVLSDLGVDFVADAFGGRVGLAMGFVAAVKVSMAASMVLSWPVTLWPMRQDLLEMLGECFGATPLSPTAYYTLTYASLAAAYAAALVTQSAYQVVGLVGATLGTAMAFVFPGMLALRDDQGGSLYRAFGWALLLAGGVLTALGVASTDSG